MASDRLFARIRQDDIIIKEHFEMIKPSDHAYEVRRLLEKAILIERKEKEIINKLNIQTKQDS